MGIMETTQLHGQLWRGRVRAVGPGTWRTLRVT
ncbi:hypothetical protein LINPERHAP2_LOCUS15201 [Linum perenne]